MYPCSIIHDASIKSSIQASIIHDANIMSSVLASITHDAKITSIILAASDMMPASCQVSLRASDMTPTSCQVSLQHQTRRQHRVKYPCSIRHDANITSNILVSSNMTPTSCQVSLRASDMTPTSCQVSLQRFSRNNDSLSSEQLKAKDLLTIRSHLSISDTITDRAELMEDCGFETYRISSS
jgi:hypothetical protein